MCCRSVNIVISEIAQKAVAHNVKFQLCWNFLLVLDAQSSCWFELTLPWPSLWVSLGRGPSHLVLMLQMFGSHPGPFTAGEREQHLQRVSHLPQQIFIFRWDELPFVHISLSLVIDYSGGLGKQQQSSCGCAGIRTYTQQSFTLNIKPFTRPSCQNIKGGEMNLLWWTWQQKRKNHVILTGAVNHTHTPVSRHTTV